MSGTPFGDNFELFSSVLKFLGVTPFQWVPEFKLLANAIGSDESPVEQSCMYKHLGLQYVLQSLMIRHIKSVSAREKTDRFAVQWSLGVCGTGEDREGFIQKTGIGCGKESGRFSLGKDRLMFPRSSRTFKVYEKWPMGECQKPTGANGLSQVACRRHQAPLNSTKHHMNVPMIGKIF